MPQGYSDDNLEWPDSDGLKRLWDLDMGDQFSCDESKCLAVKQTVYGLMEGFPIEHHNSPSGHFQD